MLLAVGVSSANLGYAQVSVGPGGTPSYAKAINVPPGVAGMSPNLGLFYAGGGVNGPVGYGWSIQGISTVTRCPATIATDGKIAGITYGPNDKLCLDGQRLIQTDASGNPAAFPQSNDALGQGSGSYIEYRTEKDTYARIRAYGYANGDSSGQTGPAYFRVWTKSGQIYEYGADPDLGTDASFKALILQTSNSSLGVKAIAWAVARIKDTLGNAIDFHYEQRDVAWGSGTVAGSPTPGHEWNLLEVDYSGNKVIFNYTDRSATTGVPQDKGEAYQLGYKNVSVRLLRSVTTYINSPYQAGTLGPASGAVAASTVQLGYDNGPVSGRSRVKSLRDCAGDATSTRCLPATTFTYAAGGNDAFKANPSVLGSMATLPMGSYQSNVYGVLAGDFNGDGRTDIIRWSNTMSQNQLWLSTTDGSGHPNFTQLTGGSYNLGGYQLFSTDGCHYSIAADFNGDGVTDILAITRGSMDTGYSCTGSGSATLLLSKGDGSFVATALPSTISFAQQKSTWTVRTRCGEEALLEPLSSEEMALSLNQVLEGELLATEGGGTCPIGQEPVEIGYLQTQGANYFLIDVDGDGILDIVTSVLPAYQSLVEISSTALCASTQCTRVFKAQANGTFTELLGLSVTNQALYSPPSNASPNYFVRPANTGDFNGDGLTDLMVLSGTWISNGKGDFTLQANVNNGSCANPIDFNGDGRTDCLYMPSNPFDLSIPQQLGIGGASGNAADFNLSFSSQPLIAWDAENQQTLGANVLDLNGDGRQDILVWSDTAANNALYVSNGDGSFTASSTFNLGSGGASPMNAPLRTANGVNSFIPGDFSGNGAIELLRIQTGTSGAINNVLYSKVDPTPPDQLISVTNGSGATTTLYYVPLNNSTPSNGASQSLGARYTSDRVPGQLSTSYPTLDVSLPMNVVATSVSDSGVGAATVATEYAYKGMKADASGRGLLGFRETLQQNASPNGTLLTIDTNWLTAYPYTGVAASTRTYLGSLNATGSSLLLSQTTNVYCDLTTITGADSSSDAAANSATSTAPCVLPSTTKVQRPFLVSTIETGTDLGGNPLPQVATGNVYDAAGNPRTITVTTTGTAAGISQQFTKVTSNTYAADNTSCSDFQTCYWILSRLSQASVTNTVPNSLASISTAAGSASNASATQGNGATAFATLSGLSFGNLNVGQTATQSATLTNNGAFNLSLTVPSAASISGSGFSFVSTTCASTLAPNASCTVSVMFTPSGATSYSGTLSIGTGAGTRTAALSGAGIQARLGFNPASLSFGNQQTGGSYVAGPVTLSNSGNAAATGVALAAPSGFAVTGSSCGATLANGASCSFTVTWSPTAAQTYGGSVSASLSSGVVSNSVSLSGTALQPSGTITAIAFGNVLLGQANTLTATVRNTGVGLLSLTPPSAASVTGNGYNLVSTTCGSSLASSGSCTVTIKFTPTVIGASVGSLSVGTGAGTLTSNLTATGTQAQLSFSPASVAWGTQQVNGSYGPTTITLTNNGNIPASGLSLGTVPTGFTIGSNTCAASLANGLSCTFTVTWNPAAVQAYGGTVTAATSTGVVSNSVTLSGTARAQAGTLTGSLAFGSVVVGQNSTLIATLTNTGVGPLSLSVPTATSVSGSGFNFLSTTCSTSLAVSGSCTTTVKYAPTAIGANSGSLTMSTGAGTLSSSLGGAAVQAVLSFSPTSLHWPQEKIHGSYYGPGLVTVVNNGNTPASNLAFLLPNGFSLVENTCPTTLSPGAANACSMAVVFAPTAVGPYSGSLTATTSTGVAQNSVALEGTGVIVAILLSPAQAFGNVQVGSSATGQMTLSNNGTVTATLGAINSSSISGAGFSFVSSNCPATLNSDVSCTVNVKFAPTVAGASSGTVTVGTNYGNVTQSVSGTGVQAQLGFSPASLSWGGQQVGGNYGPTAVTLTNAGNEPASNLVLTAPTGFSISGSTCSTSLASGSSCKFNVTWMPTAPQNYSGVITATSSTASTSSVPVSGTGLQALLSFNPSSYSWGSKAVGSGYGSSTFTLANNGNETATGMSLSSSNGAFTITGSNCGNTLANGSSCTFSVTWSPTVVQTYGASIGVSAATGSPQNSLALSGTAISNTPSISVSPTSLSFGTVAPSSIVGPLTLTVSNTGAGAATSLTWPVTYTSGTVQTGGYITSGGSCVSGGSLPAGSSCTINVEYNAQCRGVSGSRSGQMNIQGANFSTVPVSLSAATGTGACI